MVHLKSVYFVPQVTHGQLSKKLSQPCAEGQKGTCPAAGGLSTLQPPRACSTWAALLTMLLHVWVHRFGAVRAGHPFIFVVEGTNGVCSKMMLILHSTQLSVSECHSEVGADAGVHRFPACRLALA